MSKAINTVAKTIQREMFPSVVIYMLNIYVQACELGACILVFVTFAGFGLLAFANIKGEEEGKLFRILGRALGHVSTVIMGIIMLSSVGYIKSY